MGDPWHLLPVLPPKDHERSIKILSAGLMLRIHRYWFGMVCLSLFLNICWWILMVVDVSCSWILIVAYWSILHAALQRAGEGHWFPFEGYGSCCLSQLGLEFGHFCPARLDQLPIRVLRLWTEVFVPTYYNGPCCAATGAGCFLLFNVVSVSSPYFLQSLQIFLFQDAVFGKPPLRDGRTCSMTCEFQAPQIRARMAL